MPPTTSTLSRLAEVLIPLAPGRPDELRAEDSLTDQLGFDSVELARVVVALEDAFEVELPQEKLHQIRTATLAELATLIDEAGGRA